MHDNIGAQLTFIISSLENTKFGIPNLETSVEKRLDKISDFTRNTIVELRDTIWAMNKSDFTMEDLSSRIFNFVAVSYTHLDVYKRQIVDYMEVDGIKIPKNVKLSMMGQNMEMTNNQVIFNKEVSAEDFK